MIVKSNGRTNVSNEIICISDSDDDDDPDAISHIVECSDNTIKKITSQYLANGVAPEPKDKLRVETRVIARRSRGLMPCARIDDRYVTLYTNDDNAFYAGVISAHNYFKNEKWYYLVFFDDGHTQYVSCDNIRVVFGDYGTKYVHSNAKQFYDYYFKAPKSQLLEISCKTEKYARVFCNGEFRTAKLIDFDPEKKGLLLLEYTECNYGEYL